MTAHFDVAAAFAEYLSEREAIHSAQMDRQNADVRLTRLQAMFDSLAHAPIVDGFNGGKQVIRSLMSARHWRWLRVRSLMVARKRQLDLLPAAQVLSKAAMQRRTEVMYRADPTALGTGKRGWRTGLEVA